MVISDIQGETANYTCSKASTVTIKLHNLVAMDKNSKDDKTVFPLSQYKIKNAVGGNKRTYFICKDYDVENSNGKNTVINITGFTSGSFVRVAVTDGQTIEAGKFVKVVGSGAVTKDTADTTLTHIGYALEKVTSASKDTILLVIL